MAWTVLADFSPTFHIVIHQFSPEFVVLVNLPCWLRVPICHRLRVVCCCYVS